MASNIRFLKSIFRFLIYIYLLEFYLFNIILYLYLNKNKIISYIILLKYSNLKNKYLKIKNKSCSSILNAFWNREQHMVSLPYEKKNYEKKIPTKARPI